MLAASKLASVLLDIIFMLIHWSFPRIIVLHVIYLVKLEMERAQTAYREQPPILCSQTYQHQRHVDLLDQNSFLKTLLTKNEMPAPADVELESPPQLTIARVVWTQIPSILMGTVGET